LNKKKKLQLLQNQENMRNAAIDRIEELKRYIQAYGLQKDPGIEEDANRFVQYDWMKENK
jgi:hypothetical protein